MTSTILNPGKKQLLIKKNIIVRFDAIKKSDSNNKNNDTLLTSTSIPTSL